MKYVLWPKRAKEVGKKVPIAQARITNWITNSPHTKVDEKTLCTESVKVQTHPKGYKARSSREQWGG